jgi:membrane associated rhomboid family serine protease
MQQSRIGSYSVLFLLIAAMIGVECILIAADQGWVGSVRWRTLAYQFAAFWPGLLGTWQPNYAGQQILMFLSYAFVHAGPDHLIGNAIVLWLLGRQVTDHVGQIGFCVVFFLTSLGAALVFMAMTAGTNPMIGASGVVFGLAGVLVGWQWQSRKAGVRPMLETVGIVAVLVLLNVVLYLWYDGRVAWQAHLGGFIVGFGLSQALWEK